MRFPRMQACLLAAVALASAAQAQTLVSRSTNVFGNFVVGYAVVNDSGSFNEVLDSLDLSYAQSQADTGVASGAYRDLPVEGTAGFAVEQVYDISNGVISGSGASATEGSTPYGHVSVGSNAQTFMRLRFTVPSLTAYTLTGEVERELGEPTNGVAPSAQAVVQLSGTGSCCGGFFNAIDTPGTFSVSGLISPQATPELYASSTSRLNGQSSYRFNLVLTPVPEPATGGLWVAGLGALALWRKFTTDRRARTAFAA